MSRNRLVRLLRQVGLLYGLALLGQTVRGSLSLPVPGGLIGMLLLLLCLATGIARLEWVESGGEWLLSLLLLLFVPAVVGIVKYKHILSTYTIPLLGIVVVGTMAVMAVTGLVVEGVRRARARYLSDPASAGRTDTDRDVPLLANLLTKSLAQLLAVRFS